MCTDRIGSFACACKDGYNGDGKSCSDIDVCSLGTHNCTPNSQCSNGDGFEFVCICNDGYGDKNGLCVNIDECAGERATGRRRRDSASIFTSGVGADTAFEEGCAENSVCIDTEGSYTCVCDPLYRDVNGNGRLCFGPYCDSSYVSMVSVPEIRLKDENDNYCFGKYLIVLYGLFNYFDV